MVHEIENQSRRPLDPDVNEDHWRRIGWYRQWKPGVDDLARARVGVRRCIACLAFRSRSLTHRNDTIVGVVDPDHT